MAKRIPKIQSARRIILGIFLVGFTTLAILHQKLQGIPSVDALDPFGGLETLLKWLASGEFVKRITAGNIVLLGAIAVLGVVLSRFYCGWICAFGALQGVFGWLGKKIFKRRFKVPQKLDRVLRYAKYVILVGIIYFTWKTGELIIRPYDPLAAYAHLPSGLSAVWAEFSIGFILLILFMVLSMLYERAFCKYACPLGAINAILSRVPLFRIRRDAPTCISCLKCDRVCPMNINVSKADKIDSSECISCFECVTSCPTKKNTLAATIGNKKVTLKTVVIIGFAIYFGAALIGQALGMLKFTPPTITEIAGTGILKVEDIKGSTTYEELASAFGIDIDKIYREIGIDIRIVPPETKIKDTGALIGNSEFETDTVRMAIAKILGVPYAGESGTALESPQSEPVAEKLETRITAPEPVSPPPEAPAPKPNLKVPEDFALEGTMSIEAVAKALGWSNLQVIEKLGLPSDIPTDKPLREMGSQYGYTMPGLKEKIAQ